MTDLALRATLEQIVRDRGAAADLYREAHALLQQGRALAARAECSGAKLSGLSDDTLLELGRGDGADMFVKKAISTLDQRVWEYVIQHSGIERFMDAKAKAELRTTMRENPPEVTAENVRATLEGFMAQSGMIFQRGIANVFSSLDRRFKSHDGFKIGSRVILEYAFDPAWGGWNYHRRKDDTLRDIERTFFVLDGKEQPERYAGIVGLIDEAKRADNLTLAAFEVENEYFRVRGFKNGNAHVWFLRDDLLRKVNKLLGEYYGETIGDARQAADDGGLHNPKTTPAKHFGFFPTPAAVIHRVLPECRLWRPAGEPPVYLLEPSAGTGALALAAAAEGAHVDCVEIQPHLAAELRATGRLGDVLQADFLAVEPPSQLYDRVLMNPPFDRERDIDHVMHALKFLKPGGILVAIMSAGTEFRETRKSIAFRAHVEKLKGRFYDLPAGSFAESGTNVNTCFLVIGGSRW